jgi:hypothetical protein
MRAAWSRHPRLFVADVEKGFLKNIIFENNGQLC